MKVLGAKVSEQTYTRFADKAKSKGKNVSDTLRQLIDDYIVNEG